MSLKLIHQPILVGDNGHLLVVGNGLDWIIVFTRDALDVVTLQYDATIPLLVWHSLHPASGSAMHGEGRLLCSMGEHRVTSISSISSSEQVELALAVDSKCARTYEEQARKIADSEGPGTIHVSQEELLSRD